MQGQRQVNVTPNDSAAIGFNPLANFHHWDIGWYVELTWGEST